MENLFVIFIGGVVAIIALTIVVGIVRGIVQWHRNNQQPVLHEPATVTGKRSATRGHVGREGGTVSTSYFVTFELPSGERREFAIREREYAVLSERDEGVLTYQGTRYRGFERKPGRHAHGS